MAKEIGKKMYGTEGNKKTTYGTTADKDTRARKKAEKEGEDKKRKDFMIKEVERMKKQKKS